MWRKLLEPTLKLKLDAEDPSPEALSTLRVLRSRISAICANVNGLQGCLEKVCVGLKSKIKPGPTCAALQKLLLGASLSKQSPLHKPHGALEPRCTFATHGLSAAEHPCPRWCAPVALSCPAGPRFDRNLPDLQPIDRSHVPSV